MIDKLQRKYHICIWADGRMSVREAGVPSMEYPSAISIYSVDTKEEAWSLILLVAKHSYTGLEYIYPNFQNDLSDIDPVSDLLLQLHTAQQKRKEKEEDDTKRHSDTPVG